MEERIKETLKEIETKREGGIGKKMRWWDCRKKKGEVKGLGKKQE